MKSLFLALIVTVYSLFIPACGEPENIKLMIEEPTEFTRDEGSLPCDPQLLGVSCHELGQHDSAKHCQCRPAEGQEVLPNDLEACIYARNPHNTDCLQDLSAGGVWSHEGSVAVAVWEGFVKSDREMTLCFYWTPRPNPPTTFSVSTFSCRKAQVGVWNVLDTSDKEDSGHAPVLVQQILVTPTPWQDDSLMGIRLFGRQPSVGEELKEGRNLRLQP